MKNSIFSVVSFLLILLDSVSSVFSSVRWEADHGRRVFQVIVNLCFRRSASQWLLVCSDHQLIIQFKFTAHAKHSQTQVILLKLLTPPGN